MGQLHNELRRGPWSDALKNALGASREGGVERYGETITPTLDLWRSPEFAYLRNEERFARAQAAGPLAGENSLIAIGTPLGSGLIVVIEAVTASAATAMICDIGFSLRTAIAATLTLVNPPNATDARWVRDAVPLAANHAAPVEIWTGTDATFPFNNILEEIGAPVNDVGRPSRSPYTLKPGIYLHLQGRTVNVLMNCTFVGRVRRAFTGEL